MSPFTWLIVVLCVVFYRRRRTCPEGHRWTTYELDAEALATLRGQVQHGATLAEALQAMVYARERWERLTNTDGGDE